MKGKLTKFNRKFGGKIFIYSTGRSFHGYHDVLLTTEDCHEYLGELLLLNDKAKINPADKSRRRGSVQAKDSLQPVEVVDPRWIAHSLIQKYSALRITHNTTAYLQLPKFEFEIH